MTIREIANKLAEKYKTSYDNWCKENRGYIMHNDGVRELACKRIAVECTSLEDLEIQKEECLEKMRNSEGMRMNGWRVSSEVCDEIIKIFKNEEHRK